MPSPFPGMDPYLEVPELWSEVHSRLIVALADDLSEQLSDAYRVAIETRTYLSDADESVIIGIPDVSVVAQKAQLMTNAVPAMAVMPDIMPRAVTIPMAEDVQERYLEIRDARSGAVVTSIELLSPKNKRAGEGRRAYERKRYKVLSSLTNLVEIDLLRGGKPLPVNEIKRQGCYSILVSRSDLRPRADLYEFGLRQSIPPFLLPLTPEDGSLTVDLQKLLEGVYRRAKYHLAIDYSQSVKPVLSESEKTWMNTLLQIDS
ncbi:MAG: DUF4058 family protein [Phormidesmis sp.]